MHWRAVIGEFVKALGVLALVLLSCAHQPLAVSGEPGAAAQANWTLSWCGSGVPQDGKQKSSGGRCEACRLAGGLALPQCATGLLVPLAFDPGTLSIAETAAPGPVAVSGALGSRAPPVAG